MTGQLELFNTLTIIFLIGGILCAVAALFIFMRSGIREYFVLKHHDVNKDIEKETNGILEDIESEPEDHSVVNPSEILGKPAKVSNDEKPTEKQESCKGQLDDGSEKEDGAGETIATNTGKAQTKATSTHDENVEDGSEETTAINRDQEEAAMTGEGTGHTEDLGKPSAIREDQKGIKQEETKKPSTSDGKDNSGSTNKPSSGSNSAGNASKPNSGSNNGGSSNKPSSGSNNSNGGNSSNTEKPAHKHNWVNVTKTVNHPAETHQEDVYEDRQVKVKDAWDEQVKTGSTAVCRQCGYRTTDNNAMDMHCLEEGHSSTWETNYTTVHHDAVYETQRVKVGTKTVTDKAAWTETVVTGRKCSFCGETKTN